MKRLAKIHWLIELMERGKGIIASEWELLPNILPDQDVKKNQRFQRGKKPQGQRGGRLAVNSKLADITDKNHVS